MVEGGGCCSGGGVVCVEFVFLLCLLPEEMSCVASRVGILDS